MRSDAAVARRSHGSAASPTAKTSSSTANVIITGKSGALRGGGERGARSSWRRPRRVAIVVTGPVAARGSRMRSSNTPSARSCVRAAVRSKLQMTSVAEPAKMWNATSDAELQMR